jgi:hypothetical protein
MRRPPPRTIKTVGGSGTLGNVLLVSPQHQVVGGVEMRGGMFFAN